MGLPRWYSQWLRTCLPMQGMIEDAGFIPGLGGSLGAGHGNPLQQSSLENVTDRGAWQATVHTVTELDTTEVAQRAHTHTHTHNLNDTYLGLTDTEKVPTVVKHYYWSGIIILNSCRKPLSSIWKTNQVFPYSTLIPTKSLDLCYISIGEKMGQVC